MADDECAVHGVDTATLNELSDRLSESAEARVEGSDVDDQSTAEMQFGFFGNSASSAAAADPSALLPDFTNLDAETQERLQALLQAAGIAKAAQDGHVVPSAAMFADPEVLRRLSTSVSCALDEAADALTRMKGSAGGSASLTDSSADVAAADPSLAFGFTPNGAPVNVEDGESLLSLACSAGYYELAQVLLAMRTNIEDRGSKNDCTPLMEAASAGHFDIVKLLLAHGADSNAQSSTGNTPLMYACAGGHEDVVKALLESNADVEIRNENGHCPLMEAASAGHVNIAKYLVNAGASVQSVNAAEFKVGLESPLTLASYKGHIEMAKFLLKSGPKASQRLEELHTALMEASMDGHLEVAKVLLDSGAPVNLASDSFESPLTLAACGGHVDLVRLLLDRGAQIEDPNDEGYTPLMEASREGHEDVVELLLDRGANVNAQTEETGETALTLAACGGFRDVVELLVRRGGDLDLGANTPLMEAAQEGHLDTVKFLIQATLAQDDFTIDATTATSDTALTYAAENGHVDVCAALLDAGAAIDHEADGGRTALMKAAKAGHYCVVQYLIQRGAQVNKSTIANDATALSLASTHGHYDVVQLLLQNGANPNHKLKDSSTCIIEAAKGGHTTVVQLLLDWPGIQLPKFTQAPPTLQHLANNTVRPKPSCKEAEAAAVALPDDEEASPPSAFNLTLDPQFLASVQKHQQQHKDAASGFGTGEHSVLYQVPDVAHSPAQINSDWLLMQAQKALIKQAGEKLSEAEIQQLSELLKTQFRNVFPTAAPNAAAAGGVSPLVVDFQPTPALPPPPPAASTTADAATATTPTTTSGVKRKAPQAPAVDKKDISKSLPTPVSATAANAKTKSAPPGVQGKMPILEMPDGSVYRADGTVVKADGSVMKAQGAQGFVFPVPPPPPTTSKKGEPTSTPPTAPSSGASPTSMPQKVNAATQAGGGSTTGPLKTPDAVSGVDLDTQTESNHDTALTLACAGGHEELVELLLQRGADIEHRDKKGFTPLILAATAGHVGVVETLLNHGACIEAQSERTKDTALSLACSGGRKEVVDLLLKRNANKEHRNVSDYTPLSLAASGGYVDIVISLLNAGAEINSRTGSKLGISPLMLAAMNGHTQATKVLLERGSDINAQIETNRNTALTLACFQGRNEVVKLLLDYHANVEHRAKTGLTPLMEAANGGYVEVGRLLLHYDADPNTSPVPTSRDTALTIGADKGHAKFVELLVHHGAQIDARNKKGCTPLWLACHGGHLETVQTLVKHCADVDAQDNRRVSPLMIAFRKGHVKVVKYMVRHVTQFPSDQECFRYIATITDKDLLAKCRQCMEVIVAAKDRQAAEANKAAETLLEELAKEEEQAMTKKLAKQRQKEKKKAKRQAKKVQPTPVNAGDDLDGDGDDDEPEKEQQQQINETNGRLESTDDKTRSRSSSISSPSPPPPPAPAPQDLSEDDYPSKGRKSTSSKKTLAPSKEDPAALVPRVPNMMPPDEPAPHPPSPTPLANSASGNRRLLQSQQQQQSDGEQNATSLKGRRGARRARNDAKATTTTTNGTKEAMKEQQLQQRDTEWSRAGVVRRRGAGQPRTREGHSQQHNQPAGKQPTTAQPQPLGAKDHPDDPYTAGWREVDTETIQARRRSNKLTVSSSAIARVIGRGGQNINAIREATGAHIEVEKQQPKKEQQDRLITIRGSADATRHAVLMINGLIMDNDAPVADVIKKVRDKEQAAGQQAASQQQQRPPNQPTPTDAQNIAVSKKQGGGAFDVSVWSSSAGGDGRRMSIDQQPPLASSANSTTTVTASSSPAADYSPFATPNVWLQRAAKRQMQQGETQRLDFASVAAARPASNRQSPPSTSSGSTAIRDSQQPSAATMAEDQRKAPGYARPASATQQSPPNNNIGMTTPPVPTASLAALGQSKSALNTPSSNTAAFSTHSHLDNDSNSLMFAPIGLPLPASSLASNRPASATPTLGLAIDSLSSTMTSSSSTYSAAPGGPSSHSPPKKTTSPSNTVTGGRQDVWGHLGAGNGGSSGGSGWPRSIESSTAGDQLGLLQNLAQLRVQASTSATTTATNSSDWGAGEMTARFSAFGVNPFSSSAQTASTWQAPPPTRPTASAGPQTSSDRDWINQLAAQLAGASSHHQPSAAASSLSSHLLGAMGDGRSATASFQQQTSSMPTEAELTSYLLNTVLGQQHQFHVSSQQQPAEQPQSNQQQSRVLALNSVYHPPSERPMHISSHQPSRNSQLFGGPFSGFGGQQLRQSNSTAETLNTAVPPPNMSFVPPPPFFNAQMPPPPNSWSQPPPPSAASSTQSAKPIHHHHHLHGPPMPPPPAPAPPAQQQQWSANWM